MSNLNFLETAKVIKGINKGYKGVMILHDDEDDTVWLTGTYDPKHIQCKIYKRDSVIPVRELYEGLRVDRQGRRVVARYFEEGQLIAKGIAKCHKDDEFDLQRGTMVATRRLFSKLNNMRGESE